jgi:hypothetical protein
VTGASNPTFGDVRTPKRSRFAALPSIIPLTEAGKSLPLTLAKAGMTRAVSDGHQPQSNDDDRYTLRRYEDFRAAAVYVAEAFAGVPAVRRVALFGSVASPPRIESGRRRRGYLHEPKDVDLAVWLDGGVDLDHLRKWSAQALSRLWHDNEVGVAHHQVDIFLLDATGKYLGRLCHFNQCPKHKPQCRAEGCGTVPFLQQHDGFVFDGGESLHASRVRILYDRQAEKGAVLDKIPF